MATSDSPLSVAASRGLSLALGQAQVAFSSLPLAPSSDITSGRFLGAFKIAANTNDYSRGTLGVSPDDSVLYMAGYRLEFDIRSYSIPSLVNETQNTAVLNAASELQRSGNLYSRIPVKDWPDPTGSGDTEITGIYATEAELIVNGATYYDASGTSVSTAFRILDNTDLANSTIKGTYKVGPQSRANGWITKAPDSLVNAIGGDLIFGWGTDGSIVSRLSNGPSLYPVSQAELEAAADDAALTTTPLIDYPHTNKLRDDLLNYGGAVGGTNNTVHVITSAPKTGFIVPGSRTYAVIGASGGHNPGPLDYTQQSIDGVAPISPGTPCSNPYVGHGDTGEYGTIFYKNTWGPTTLTTKQNTYSVTGYGVWDEADRGPYIWLYDLDAVSGLANPYDAEPYFAGYASTIFNGNNDLRGACFNAASGRLYVFTAYEGGTNEDTGEIVIMVYDLSGVV